jgi:hypothetical protein
LSLGVAQYNSRIFELRKSGFNIENRTESIEGIRHSWFRLVGQDTLRDPNSDWYIEATGRPRPADLPPTGLGPLFKQGNL